MDTIITAFNEYCRGVSSLEILLSIAFTLYPSQVFELRKIGETV